MILKQIRYTAGKEGYCRRFLTLVCKCSHLIFSLMTLVQKVGGCHWYLSMAHA